MVALIVTSVTGGSSASASALPAPAQYTSPPAPPFGLTSEALLIVGALLLYLCLTLVLLVYLRRRRPRRPGPMAGTPSRGGALIDAHEPIGEQDHDASSLEAQEIREASEDDRR